MSGDSSHDAGYEGPGTAANSNPPDTGCVVRDYQSKGVWSETIGVKGCGGKYYIDERLSLYERLTGVPVESLDIVCQNQKKMVYCDMKVMKELMDI